MVNLWPRPTFVAAIAGFSVVIVYGFVRKRLEKAFLLRRSPTSANPSEKDCDDFRDASAFFARNQDRFTAVEQLRLYGLFKQGTVGDISADTAYSVEPSNSRRMLMHDAWSELAGMTQREAQDVYVGLIEEHCPYWRSGSCGGGSGSWAVGSVPVNTIGDSLDKDETQIGAFCELCAQGNVVEVEAALAKDPSLLFRADREGLTCLHWASDRGHEELAKVLIEGKCDINKQDDSGNTALHVAVMAEQGEVVRLLLDAKADPLLVNLDGETAIYLIRKEDPHFLVS